MNFDVGIFSRVVLLIHVICDKEKRIKPYALSGQIANVNSVNSVNNVIYLQYETLLHREIVGKNINGVKCLAGTEIYWCSYVELYVLVCHASPMSASCNAISVYNLNR